MPRLSLFLMLVLVAAPILSSPGMAWAGELTESEKKVTEYIDAHRDEAVALIAKGEYPGRHPTTWPACARWARSSSLGPERAGFATAGTRCPPR